MRPKAIFAVTKKELSQYFNNPTAYIILTVFLVLWEFLFFRNVFLVGEASLRLLLSYVPWLFIVLVPALTMGSISSEKSEGTLEFLLTNPLTVLELIIGKFVATFLFIALALAAMFPIALSLDQLTNAGAGIDWGVVAGQYLASLMLSGVFIAAGIMVSTFFASPIASLLVAATLSFILVIIGFELITLTLPTEFAAIAERLSVLAHFESMARGVIDARDLWYFVSAIVIFLALAYLQIIRIRLGNKKQRYRQYMVGVSLFVGIAVLVNVVGARIPGRFDLTQDQMYELSPVTLETLEGLDDVVNIRLYASNEIPPKMRPILRDTKDLLRDYASFGGDKVQLITKNPSGNAEVIEEAASYGVREVQFNVIGAEELQVKKGYLGLAVEYGNQSESLPIISTTADLEYQLTSFIRKLTTENKKQIGYLIGHGEKSTFEYPAFTGELENTYNVSVISLDTQDVQIPEDLATLIIAGANSQIEEAQREKIVNYYEQGGSILFLLDGTNVDSSSLFASTNDFSLADFVSYFGIELQQDIVYDLRSNEPVNFGQGDVSFITNYPFWIRALPSSQMHPITRRIGSLVLPWPSSLEINQETLTNRGLEATPLLVTSNFASNQIGSFQLSPDQQLSPLELEQKTLAYALIGQEAAEEKVPRLVFIGDSDFLGDQIALNSPENIAFALETVAWLAQEESLAEIQLKQVKQRNLEFSDPATQIPLVKYGNLALVGLLPLLIGGARLLQRSNLRNISYRSDE